MVGILEGIKVLDMGQAVAVPTACATMADWGAEVLKIEPPWGDMARGFKKLEGVDTTTNGVNWNIQLLNRNKKSIAVDLKKQEGKEIVYKLIQCYDVFVTNYELSSIKRLKMDYTTLSQLNPKLIYGILTAYGTKGPDKDERGFDYSAAWARSGIQYLIGEKESPPPPQRGGMMDRTVSSHIVSGILAALLHRERTSKGQEIEFSLYHTAVWTLGEDIQATLVGTPLPRHNRIRVPNPLFNSYRCKDGRWFQLSIIQSDLQWHDFCKSLDIIPELEHHPDFINMDTRQENCEELICALDIVFSSRNRDEWEKQFRENNIIYGRIDSPTEVINDTQAIANNFFSELGKIKVINNPVKFNQNPGSVRTPAPELGQHTEEILLGLGYSWNEIFELKKEGVIL